MKRTSEFSEKLNETETIYLTFHRFNHYQCHRPGQALAQPSIITAAQIPLLGPNIACKGDTIINMKAANAGHVENQNLPEVGISTGKPETPRRNRKHKHRNDLLMTERLHDPATSVYTIKKATALQCNTVQKIGLFAYVMLLNPR